MERMQRLFGSIRRGRNHSASESRSPTCVLVDDGSGSVVHKCNMPEQSTHGSTQTVLPYPVIKAIRKRDVDHFKTAVAQAALSQAKVNRALLEVLCHFSKGTVDEDMGLLKCLLEYGAETKSVFHIGRAFVVCLDAGIISDYIDRLSERNITGCTSCAMFKYIVLHYNLAKETQPSSCQLLQGKLKAFLYAGISPEVIWDYEQYKPFLWLSRTSHNKTRSVHVVKHCYKVLIPPELLPLITQAVGQKQSLEKIAQVVLDLLESETINCGAAYAYLFMLVHAGYILDTVYQEYLWRQYTVLALKYQQLLREPPNLQDLCVRTVRGSLNSTNILTGLLHLKGVPPRLMQLLTLDNIL